MKPNQNELNHEDSELNQQADELVELLDALAASGSQHINLDIGNETRVQTINSTECSGKLGPCAVPNLGEESEEEEF